MGERSSKSLWAKAAELLAGQRVPASGAAGRQRPWTSQTRQGEGPPDSTRVVSLDFAHLVAINEAVNPMIAAFQRPGVAPLIPAAQLTGGAALAGLANLPFTVNSSGLSEGEISRLLIAVMADALQQHPDRTVAAGPGGALTLHASLAAGGGVVAFVQGGAGAAAVQAGGPAKIVVHTEKTGYGLGDAVNAEPGPAPGGQQGGDGPGPIPGSQEGGNGNSGGDGGNNGDGDGGSPVLPGDSGSLAPGLDAAPAIGFINSLTVANVSALSEGQWSLDEGADGLGSIRISLLGTDESSPVKAWAGDYDPASGQAELTAYLDEAGQTPYFTVTLDDEDGYQFELINPVLPEALEQSVEVAALGMGGNRLERYLEEILFAQGAPAPEVDIRFSANEGWAGAGHLGAAATVNTNNNGLGVGRGQTMDRGDSLTLEFLAGDGGGAATHPSAERPVERVELRFAQGANGAQMSGEHSVYVITRGEGGEVLSQGFQLLQDGVLRVDAGDDGLIHQLTVVNAGDRGVIVSGVSTLAAAAAAQPEDVMLNFRVEVADADGDTVTQDFSVLIDGDGGGRDADSPCAADALAPLGEAGAQTLAWRLAEEPSAEIFFWRADSEDAPALGDLLPADDVSLASALLQALEQDTPRQAAASVSVYAATDAASWHDAYASATDLSLLVSEIHHKIGATIADQGKIM